MIDTHCHLNFHSFKKDYIWVAKAAFDVGVTKIINCGAKLDSSRRAVKIAREIPFCFAAVGVHPHHAQEFSDLNALKIELEKIIEEDKKNYPQGVGKIVAIGECGLDYYQYDTSNDKSHVSIHDNKLRQKELLLLHMDVAKKYDLPIIFHCREAYEDLINLLRTTDYKLQTGAIHCFQGNLEELQKFLNLGLYIGYDGFITYAKNYEELVSKTPIDRILTETDSPWLTPEPLRGTRNTPANVKIICEKIGEIKNVSPDEIDKITTENAGRLFSI